MNYRFLPSLLLGLAAGCQAPQKPVAGEAGAAARPDAATPDELRWVATTTLPPPGPGDTLTAAARALLRTHDLAPLWANKDNREEQDHALDGFYGPDHHRIEFYFDTVVRSAQHPEEFVLLGRNRYRKVITHFGGGIIVQAIFKVTPTTYTPPAAMSFYVVRAAYELWEDSTAKRSGTYRGEVLLDLEDRGDGMLHQTSFSDTGYYPPNQGGDLAFRGNWTDNRTGHRRPAVWAENLQAVTPLPVLEEQQLWARHGDVNPALVKRGWNEMWGNDEWWAKAPEPRLNP